MALPVVVAETADLDARVAVLLLGIAFSFLLRKQDLPGPATRMQQVRQLLKQLPELLAHLKQHRVALSIELTRLLKQGPERYFTAALRELRGLAK